MKSFEDWLREVGLEHYASVFAENDIDFGNARTLSEADLRELGLTLGHRRNFLAALTALESPSTVGSALAVARAQAQATPAGERRQLTVMFCDLVGSTALSEKLDPEELRSLLHDYRTRCGEVIGRYEGFVARYVGDGILTYFGWPKAHEEDAERGVRAALEIVQAVKRVSSTEPLSVRIGIATGPVVVGEQAGEGDQAKLAVGSTPNLAARLQRLASADQVVIAASTRGLIGDAFELSDLGEHILQGISQPVRAWRIEGLSEAASRFEASHGAQLTPLVGREQEIGLLLDRWQLSREGEGQVVLLSGEPGIGKSRILSALRERLEQQGAGTLRFQCSPYYVNSAFYPTIDNFERALKYGRDEPASSKLEKLEALVVGQYGRPLSDLRFVATILSIPCEERYGALTMTPQKHKDETLRALVDLTEAAARKQPSVMLFEDLHWADPTTLEVLGLLIDRVKNIPLLIVLTHRPEFASRWSGHGHVTALNLSKLTRAQSSAIVVKLAGGKTLPAELLEQILTRTDGVPLYVEEFTKATLESGELKDAGDHYDYAGATHTVTIPATLRDSLMARLDRFMQVKKVAQIGAAIGREFSYELMSAVAPMPKAQLDDGLERLTESGLAFRRGTPPDAVYTFKHALVQDAAYESLLKSRRQELHARIAREIERRLPKIKDTEPEMLAHHYTQAGVIEVAIPLWCKAGELALRRMALKETIAHMNQGLQLAAKLAPSPERQALELPLRSPLVTAWSELRGWASREVSENASAVVRLAKALGKSEYLPAGFWGGWQNTISEGRVADSLEWAQRLLAEADATGSADLRIVAHAAALASHFFLGQLAAAREHCDRVLALYDERRFHHLIRLIVPEFKTYAGVFASLSTWNLGYPDQSVRIIEQTDAHARRLGKPFDLSWVLTMGSYVFSFRREPEKLLERAAEAERLAREHSMVYMLEAFCPASKGLALVCAGQAAEAIALLRSALAHKATVGSHVWNPYVKAAVAEALALQGVFDEALLTLDEVLEQIQRPRWQERVHLAEVLRLKGWMLQRQGKLAAAEENYLAALDVAREQQAKSWELRTSTSLARLWRSQGKRKEAHELLTPIYNWFTEGFDTKDLKEAKELAA